MPATWAGDAVAEVYAPLTASDLRHPHGRDDGRDAEAGGQRLPGRQDLVRQRDRQPLRRGRRRRHRGGPGDRPRPPHRSAVPPGRHRVRRLVLRQGPQVAGPRVHPPRRQLAHGRRGPGHQRPAVGPGARQARRPPRRPARRTVAVLGVAFKPGTSNVRDANSIPLLAGLHTAGVAIRAYDPKATRELLQRDSQLDEEVLAEMTFARSAMEAVTGADAAVLVTEWPEILGLDWAEVREAMAGTLLIDGRNALDPAAVAAGRAALRRHRPTAGRSGRPPVGRRGDHGIRGCASASSNPTRAGDGVRRCSSWPTDWPPTATRSPSTSRTTRTLNCSWMRCDPAHQDLVRRVCGDELDVLAFTHGRTGTCSGGSPSARRRVLWATPSTRPRRRGPARWGAIRAPVDLQVTDDERDRRRHRGRDRRSPDGAARW